MRHEEELAQDRGEGLQEEDVGGLGRAEAEAAGEARGGLRRAEVDGDQGEGADDTEAVEGGGEDL